MNRIITIGREFGSGGRELGCRLSEYLGIAYYDQEIITEVANRTELSEKYIKSIMEQRPIFSYPIHIGRSIGTIPNPQILQSQNIFQKQCEILREVSEKSSCVIVGRCADYVLRDKQPYRVFVYASMESRIARCREREPGHDALTEKELKQHIMEIDRRRSRYYSFYTDQKWGERMNYDLCINTTNSNIKDIATIVSKLFVEM